MAYRMVLAFLLVRCCTVVKRTCCPRVVKNGSLLVKKISASAVMFWFLSRMCGGTWTEVALTLAGVC